jgi:ABC-type transport system involved in cytochrome c biogenesis permease component
MDDYSKMAMLWVIVPVLIMGSQIVDRRPSNLNWTSVAYPFLGRPVLLSNVVTLLVIVPPKVDVSLRNR